LVTYNQRGESRGIATISFFKPDAAAKAANELNGLLVDGKTMKVMLNPPFQTRHLLTPTRSKSSSMPSMHLPPLRSRPCLIASPSPRLSPALQPLPRLLLATPVPVDVVPLVVVVLAGVAMPIAPKPRLPRSWMLKWWITSTTVLVMRLRLVRVLLM
jgi:hypothetical protein